MLLHQIATILRNVFPLFCLLALAGCNTMVAGLNNFEGQNYYKEGNYSMARMEFQRAIANQPFNANYVYNLAAAMQKQGDVVGAEQTYRKGIQLDPSHQPSYHGLISLLNQQGRQDEATSLLQAWAGSQPHSPVPRVEMAWLQREMGDTAGAEASLRSALEVQPNHPTALAHLGQIYQDTGRQGHAVAMYKRSLHHRWYQPEVHSRLAQLNGGGAHSSASRRFAYGKASRFAYLSSHHSPEALRFVSNDSMYAPHHPPTPEMADGPILEAPVQSTLLPVQPGHVQQMSADFPTSAPPPTPVPQSMELPEVEPH